MKNKKREKILKLFFFLVLLCLDHFPRYFYDEPLTPFDIKANPGNFPGAREVQRMLPAALADFWCEWKLVGVERIFLEHQPYAL